MCADPTKTIWLIAYFFYATILLSTKVVVGFLEALLGLM